MTRALKLEQVLKEEDILTPGDLSAVISLLFPEPVKGFRLCNQGRSLPTHLPPRRNAPFVKPATRPAV